MMMLYSLLGSLKVSMALVNRHLSKLLHCYASVATSTFFGFIFSIYPCYKLEFEEAGNLLEANRDATTISIEDDDMPERQRKAAGFTPDVDDEDPHASDDNTEVCTTITLFSKRISYFLNYELFNVVASKTYFINVALLYLFY